MLSYRLGTVNDFHFGFKPVLSYSKPYNLSTYIREDKEMKNAFTVLTQATFYNNAFTVWKTLGKFCITLALNSLRHP